MTGGLPFGGIVGSTVEELAAGAQQLYTCEARWTEAHTAGRRIVRTLFNEEGNGEALVERVLAARAGLQDARRENIVGSMLWMHQHRSTQYFSQWIEAKNTNKSK